MTIALRVLLLLGLILLPSTPLYAQDTQPVEPEQATVSLVDPLNTAEESPDGSTEGLVANPISAATAATKEFPLWPPYEQKSKLPAYGRAMYYNPGIMELVLENRLKSGQVSPCRECVGYVAMLRVGDLNSKVWIQLPDGTVEGPFQVIDAADKKHIPMLIEKGWIVDIDYETAMRWKMTGPKSVTVWAEPPLSYRTLSNSIASDYEVDIYRHEKLDYFNQSHEYSGYVETLYVR